jgi:hypothetical protein
MQKPPHETQPDFATEHESPGFKASIPISVGAFEAAGPLETFDPDYRGFGAGDPHRWQHFKDAARKAWQRMTKH